MEDLSNIHKFATELTNVTGQVTPILEFNPDDGLMLEILNRAVRGNAPGIPLYLDLRDSNGDPLPLDTAVRFEFETPTDEQRNRVSEVKDNIQVYRTLSIQDQQDEEYVDSVKIPLLGSALRVRDIDSFYLSIECSEQIDWSQSQAYIEGSVVNKRAMN